MGPPIPPFEETVLQVAERRSFNPIYDRHKPLDQTFIIEKYMPRPQQYRPMIVERERGAPVAMPKSRNILILYEQPVINVVRRYTSVVVLGVNPEEYQKKFDKVLLDTPTLLQWTRRLNINDNMITPPTTR